MASVRTSHLLHQFEHLGGARSRGGLIRHAGHPFDQAGPEKAAHGHEHQAYGAVSARVGANAARQCFADHVAIHGIENDDGVARHAQGRGGIDPVALPIAFPQRGVNFRGVFAALATDEHFASREFAQVGGVFEDGAVAGLRWRGASGIRGGEENRLKAREILFFAHPLHQDAADHASPAYESHA